MEPNTVMLFVWIGLMVAFTVIEAVTVQLVTIWFARGQLSCPHCEYRRREHSGAMADIRCGICRLSAGHTPSRQKVVNAKAQPTNADRCIGQTALVTEAIDNEIGTGQVNSKGIIWTARSLNGEQIEKGASVVIEQIEGVKVLVTRAS